jgi:hypothetical protein
MSADAAFARTQGIEETEDFCCLWFLDGVGEDWLR